MTILGKVQPDAAWSDAQQQITPNSLQTLLDQLVVRSPKGLQSSPLQQLRSDIDEIDRQLLALLAQRMRVCRAVGEYKKESNLTVLRTHGPWTVSFDANGRDDEGR